MRLDLVESTGHDVFARKDYALLERFGLRTARESLRWHRIEETEGQFDFRSADTVLNAADNSGTELILDLLHFGWPDYTHPLDQNFPGKFERFTRAVTRYLKARAVPVRYIAPVNEVSFLSWAGGEAGFINPCRTDCAPELKRNLVRAAVCASDLLLNELPGVRLVSPEPVIHIVPNPALEHDEEEAENYRLAQYQAWDMLSGRMAPELGGKPEYLDILGANFYDRNEWVHHGRRLVWEDNEYRPFRDMLFEVWTRYHRPLFVSETGTEDDVRPAWFNYVCDEVTEAVLLGVPVKGICLYPILNHPGWEDDRHCHNGLFDYPNAAGEREIYWPLAHVLREQQQKFPVSNSLSYELPELRRHLSFASPMELRVSTPTTSDEPVGTKQ